MTTPKTKAPAEAKIVHTLSKDGNGNPAITSNTVSKPKDKRGHRQRREPSRPRQSNQ